MTEMTETAIAPHDQLTELPDGARRVLRWTIAALVIALAGLVLGGVSLGLYASAVGRESSRNTWDAAMAAHVSCVSAARSRAVTIDTAHGQYDAQGRQLDAQDRFVDLVEGIVDLISSEAFRAQAFAQTAAERARVDDDRARLATDVASFDASRPPLDEAACPPPPDSPRP